MELDLDAFLQSHDATTSDDEDTYHHSAVDELLNIDSDDASSPSSSSRSNGLSSPQSNSNSIDSFSLDSQLVTDRDVPAIQSKFRSISGINSGDTSSVSRQLSLPLFGSNAKPGAAVAAAAAASRSIPSPHAAAIKLRRERFIRLSLDPKASIGSEILSGSGTSSEIGNSDTNIVEGDFKLDNLETENIVSSGEVITEHESKNRWGDGFPSEETKADVDNAFEAGRFEIDVGDDTLNPVTKSEIGSLLNDQGLDLDKDGSMPVIDDDSDDRIEGNDLESATISTLQYVEGVVPFAHGNVDDNEVEEDSISVLSERNDFESTKTHANDVDFGLQAGGDVSVEKGGIDLDQGSEKRDRETPGTSSPSLKPLQFAEELEKKHAFTGLHWEEGAAAQPMKLEGVHRGSTVLGYLSTSSDNIITKTISSPAFKRDHGTPQSLAVHLNYIAVGMSRGVIVIFPSKYSLHLADNIDTKLLILGLQGDRSYAPVTSMSFNQQGDLLFAGYADGHYSVWDVQRVSVAKIVTEHKAPVVHMLYMGMDSQVARQFNIISGDSKGVVKLIRFSTSSWLNRFSTSKTSTLLDESTRTVVCASPLLSGRSSAGTNAGTSGIGSMMGVVPGDPSSAEEGVVIFVTHQSGLVAKVVSSIPEVYAQLPKPDGVREGSMPYTAWKYIAENVEPLLAIAWDSQVQVAKLVKSELKIYATWTLDSSAVGVAWLDSQMLVVLTSAGQLCLYANDGTLIHDTSYAVDGCRIGELIGYHTFFTNVSGNSEKAHHNCIAVRGASLYLLGPTHLVVSRLLPWKERIEVLRKGGDWMGAFNMAMMLYDGQAHGVFDLPTALDDVQMAVMPYLVELLLAYVDEVFSYISVALGNQAENAGNLDDSKDDSFSMTSKIKEQYTHVGGVAVEVCVHIKRNDILFEKILSRFESVQQKETFLELLEPYILKDMLGSLPPEIMQALVEHYSTKGWLQRVEQCVLHMDISSLDFNQVFRLCREHSLYGALIYLFNKGLDDFRTPLEELLRVFRNNDSESAPSLGYRMLVYLKYCFSGYAFPPGHGALSPARLPSLREELISLLLEDSNAPSSWGLTNLSSTEGYKNLYYLLELDTEATLDVLRCAIIDENPSHNSAADKDSASPSQDLIQKTVNVLALIPEKGKSTSIEDIQPNTNWPSKVDIDHILDFISHFVACKKVKVSNRLLSQIFEHLTLEADIPHNVERKHGDCFLRREKEVLALLNVVPETDWDDKYLLNMCEKAHFYQVCGFIHNSKHRYLAALDSFMKDIDEPIHAFFYIDYLMSDKRSDILEAAVISRIPDLVQLSREGTLFLVIERFFQDFQQILADLRSNLGSLFLYLKTVMEIHSTGTMRFDFLKKGEPLCFPGARVHDFLERISEFPKFLRENPVHVTDEMTELYLELLCQYEPNSVLHYLETCESYRVDQCLRLCQEHGIIDAAAYLLEKTGDVGSALSFTLSDLADKFSMLGAAAQSVNDYAGLDHLDEFLKKKEVTDILYIVHTCVALCQRNSSRLDPNESEALWFQLLDTFCEPLTNPCIDKMDSEQKLQRRQQNGEAFGIKWKIRGSDKGARILRKLFSMFIKEMVEGMIGYVRLPTVMMKLLSDNGSQEFGDFKATILGLLGTYDFERRILDTARSLIEDDAYYTMSLLKRGASHGHGPRSLVCCICNCLLTTAIRVYNCGHASHLHCEIPASHRALSTGCPICMPKKKGSVPDKNGLVSKPLPKHRLTQGTGAVHVHENDRQLSRYEILTNLDKDKRMIQVDNMPQLRLAPPAVYHEKVKKGVAMSRGDGGSNTSGIAKIEKTKMGKAIKDRKKKGSAARFSLKSNIFGKENSYLSSQ
uniref:vacuolar protein sorting-associated protein 8 homolog n=1 Tax=Erigeron canadensis TaxID=72917 RepID=UPI001CB9C51F|nr:vacuolar protein sorting-associated protein 8 homolog [Erigeron canadensis]